MTVAQLIEQLMEQPQEARIYFVLPDGTCARGINAAKTVKTDLGDPILYLALSDIIIERWKRRGLI